MQHDDDSPLAWLCLMMMVAFLIMFLIYWVKYS